MGWLREILSLWGAEGLKFFNALRFDMPADWPIAYSLIVGYTTVVIWFAFVFLVAAVTSAIRRRWRSR